MEPEIPENQPKIDEQLSVAEKRLASINKKISKYNKRAQHQLRFLTIIFSFISGLIIVVTIAQGFIAWHSLNLLSASSERLDTTLKNLVSDQYQYFIKQDNKIDDEFEKNTIGNKKEITEFSSRIEDHIKSVLGEAVKTTKLEIRYGEELLNGKTLEMNLRKEAQLNFSKINFLNVGDKTIKTAKYIFSFSNNVQSHYGQELYYPPPKGFKVSATFTLYTELLREIPSFIFVDEYGFSIDQDAQAIECELKVFYEDYYQETAKFKIVHKEK